MFGVFRRLTNGISRGFLAFTERICHTESPDLSSRISSFLSLGFILLFVVGLGVVAIGAVWDFYKFNQLTPAEHLAQAKIACGGRIVCFDTASALHHLSRIATTEQEYGEAHELQTRIQAQVARGEIQAQLAREKGEVADKDTSETAQERRNENAKLHSYWSTIVRVNTDMDSFWLPDEERTCQTYPDEKGRVATVTCDTTAHANHNIPVEFWGGVDRNTASDWKCRREKDIFRDVFVCRAIN
jgi:hypothetical protein